jgi:hypothetical protein
MQGLQKGTESWQAKHAHMVQLVPIALQQQSTSIY